MKKPVGSIGWLDITVDDAASLKDFYREVVGWTVGEFDMGGYSDYVMQTPQDDEGVAGVCHARGGNTGLPKSWLIYIVVEDLDRSLDRTRQLGGKALSPIRSGGGGRFAVIEDPTGAILALYEYDAG